MYKYLLFDLDNTLLDFSQTSAHALKKVFFEFGVPYLPEYIRQYQEVNDQCWKAYEQGRLSQAVLRYERFRQFMEQVRLEADIELMSELYLKWLSEGIHWVEGAQDLLKMCRAHFQIVIVTNGLKDVQRPRLRRSGLEKMCAHIVISEEIGAAKPQEAYFEYTFRQMGFPQKQQALMIGDNIHSDIRGGHAYGLHTCWYNPKGKKRENGDAQPTYEVGHLREVESILRSKVP